MPHHQERELIFCVCDAMKYREPRVIAYRKYVNPYYYNGPILFDTPAVRCIAVGF